MTLFTSYLGFFNRKTLSSQKTVDGLEEIWIDNSRLRPFKVERIFVMRNRGNDIVTPSDFLLKQWKNGEISWSEYSYRYLNWIHSRQGIIWMKEIGEKAKEHDVVLVCYEKDFIHCHRLLLAHSVVKWSGCQYGGELQ